MQVVLLGIAFALILEGIGYAFFPGQMKEMAKMLHSQPNQTLRMLGLSILLAGLVIIWVISQIA